MPIIRFDYFCVVIIMDYGYRGLLTRSTGKGGKFLQILQQTFDSKFFVILIIPKIFSNFQTVATKYLESSIVQRKSAHGEQFTTN